MAAAVAALVALPSLIFEPASTDLAAQTFRADLWSEHGWVLWNDAWYSGHLVPGYSLIYPPLGALVGPRLLGFLAAIAAAAAFAALARRYRPGRGALVAGIWLALGVGALIYTGRVTFMLGLALGLLALLSIECGPLAAALAAATALASPVAGLFTALAGAALVLGGRPRQGLPLAIGAGATTIALVLVFPVGGTQPFPFSTVWWVVAACAVAVVVIPPDLRVLRIGVGLYILLLVALFVVPTPIGTNGPRLGALFLGPLGALALIDRRPRLVALVALPLLYWQLAAPVGDLIRGVGDPSTEAGYYAPLLTELDRRAKDVPVRIEIPPTQERWEAVHVAERYPLARGWLRQLETSDIEGFTEGRLTASSYEDWLRERGVSYVALSDATLDYIAEDEGDLLAAGGLPFLHELWSDGNWTLWEVLAPGGQGAPAGAALASGGARVVASGPDGYTVRVPGPGEYLVRQEWSPYLEPGGADACARDGGDGGTLLSVASDGPTGPQEVRLDARLSFAGLLGRNSSCSE